MPKPLQPVKDFLGKTRLCVVLAMLPIAILEGMWSDLEWRGFARRVNGLAAMWILYSIG